MIVLIIFVVLLLAYDIYDTLDTIKFMKSLKDKDNKGGFVIIEIAGDTISIEDTFIFELPYEKDLVTLNFYDPKDNTNWVCLDKPELAQLISALQVMHDKMGDA